VIGKKFSYVYLHVNSIFYDYFDLFYFTAFLRYYEMPMEDVRNKIQDIDDSPKTNYSPFIPENLRKLTGLHKPQSNDEIFKELREIKLIIKEMNDNIKKNDVKIDIL
jgi:hypothetical protein